MDIERFKIYADDSWALRQSFHAAEQSEAAPAELSSQECFESHWERASKIVGPAMGKNGCYVTCFGHTESGAPFIVDLLILKEGRQSDGARTISSEGSVMGLQMAKELVSSVQIADTPEDPDVRHNLASLENTISGLEQLLAEDGTQFQFTPLDMYPKSTHPDYA